jgi:hypothetical protein
MNRRHFFFVPLAFWVLTFFSPAIYSKRKLLILPFQNREKNNLYGYLENSLTEAVTKKLHENFVFETPSIEKWQTLAAQNLVHREELYTYTAGMQLGSWLKQDVVISGSFVVIPKQTNQSKVNTLIVVTRVRVFDISKKKLVTEFEVEGFVDASIFESVELLAARVAKEAAIVLPNEYEWRQAGAEDFFAFQHHMTFMSEIGAFSTPGGSDAAIGSGSQLLPKDFHPLKFSLIYTRRRSFFRDLFVTGQVTYATASRDLSVERASSTITASSNTLGFSAGAGYVWSFWSRFYAAPVLRLGYQLGNITLNYDNLSTKPLDIDGQEVAKRIFSANAPLVALGAFGGYRMNEMLGIELRSEYEALIFTNRLSAQIVFGLAITMGVDI